MPPRPHRKLLLDLALAACLVALGIAVLVAWLLLALLALGHALEPWNNAGILLFGPGFLLLAAVFCVPGCAWARKLSEEFSPPWSGRARITARIGSLALALGGVLLLVCVVAARA